MPATHKHVTFKAWLHVRFKIQRANWVLIFHHLQKKRSSTLTTNMSKFTSTYLNAYYQLASRNLSYKQIFHAFLCPKICHGDKLIVCSQDLNQYGLREEMQTWSWCGFGFLWVWNTLSWVGKAWENRKLSCLRASKSKKTICAKPLLPWWILYRRIN